MTGIKKGMDLFGVVILGLLTAVGGGALRDVLLGLTPPAMLTDPMYTIISICVSIASFVLLTDRLVMNHRLLLDRILLVTDSLGLGSFTVYGVSVALRASDGGLFLVVFLGVITGVGGGVLRDALAGDMPYIFTKHIYACASIVGALACALLWDVMGSTAAMLIGLVLIVVIRFLAAYFRWDLPRAKISDTNTKS
jgi:uncharacterized membrane protein YeiH